MGPLMLVVLLVSAVVADEAGLTIKNADRSIDVGSQLVKISHRLTLANAGPSAVSSFLFPIEPKAVKTLSFFSAQVCRQYLS